MISNYKSKRELKFLINWPTSDGWWPKSTIDYHTQQIFASSSLEESTGFSLLHSLKQQYGMGSTIDGYEKNSEIIKGRRKNE